MDDKTAGEKLLEILLEESKIRNGLRILAPHLPAAEQNKMARYHELIDRLKVVGKKDLPNLLAHIEANPAAFNVICEVFEICRGLADAPGANGTTDFQMQ